MGIAEEMKSFTENIIASYEDRISSIAAIFADTHQTLGEYQKALFETHEERELLNKELRDKLAKTESLRHKDFDQMMQGILKEQQEREAEVKELLGKYIAEQKEVAAALKEGLADINKQLVKGERIRLEDFKREFAAIKQQQLARQDQVVAMLKDFQAKVAQYRKENEELAKGIRELLSKGETIRIRDFKAMLKGFQEERTERSAAWRGLSVAMVRKRAREVVTAGR